jgi:hypothetical protein
MQTQEFKDLMKSELGQLFERLHQDMPLIAPQLHSWAKGLSGSHEPADYFLHPVAFPLMLLPWWVEKQLSGTNDPEFQSDLIFSNASGYYYTRLVDNVMDRHATVEYKLLPAAGYFVNQFRASYHPYFSAMHPFWDYFQQTWSEFCDVTAADGHLVDIDRQTFESLVAHKVCASKVGVAAVCFRYQREELLPLWSEWIDLFGCWHLFREDLFDWQPDLSLGTVTYFLSEAKRRKRAEEAEVSWIAREGLEWAMEQLNGWMGRLRQMNFVPQEVVFYLEGREKELLERRESLRPALAFIQKVSSSGKHE